MVQHDNVCALSANFCFASTVLVQLKINQFHCYSIKTFLLKDKIKGKCNQEEILNLFLISSQKHTLFITPVFGVTNCITK